MVYSRRTAQSTQTHIHLQRISMSEFIYAKHASNENILVSDLCLLNVELCALFFLSFVVVFVFNLVSCFVKRFKHTHTHTTEKSTPKMP